MPINPSQLQERPQAEDQPIGHMEPRRWDAPIPGENYTSDTKNYAWHRPPEHTDLDNALEDAARKLTSEEGSVGILTMLENGLDVATLTQTFVMSGVGAGKWTIDFGLLMAGPVSHIIALMAEAYDIKYDMGVENRAAKTPTKSFFKELAKTEEPMEVEETFAATAPDEELTGFMAGGLE